MYTSMFRKAMLGDTATLNLDFTTGVLDSRLTFTRSTTATYINSSGYVTTAAINEPRFEFNPTSFVANGLLFESAVTNFVTQSQALTAANYGMMALSVDGTLTDPMGGTNSSKVAANGASGGHQFLKYINAGVGITTVTVSIYAKKNGYKYLYLSEGVQGRAAARFDLDSGVIDNTMGTSYVSSSATPAGASGSGWWRCSLTSNVLSNENLGWSFAGAPTLGVTYSANSASYTGTNVINDGIYAIGLQVEAGSGASSYIPTGASQVTRTEDSCVMTGTNFSSWSNSLEGTFLCNFQTTYSGNTPSAALLLTFDSTGSKRIVYLPTGANTVGSYDGVNILIATGTATGVLAKVASSYNQSNKSIVLNGGTVATGVVAAGYSSATSLGIGIGGSVSAHFKQIKFYPIFLTNTQLQTLTTP